MPDISIIDSHVHLWDPDKFEIPWLTNVPPINNVRTLDDYKAATEGIQIEGIVYLQVEVAPPYALLEARDLVAMVRAGSLVKAVVAWAPLEFGEKCRYFLEEMNAIGPEVRGIRRIVQDEPDPNYCLQPNFIRGTQLLAEYDLSCDICTKYPQMDATIELVRLCPKTQFILDHISKPNIRGGMFEPWASQVTKLAKLPNVVCKISGVLTEASTDGWTMEEIAPYTLHALNSFGPDRVVFGSDWPVLTLADTYQTWVGVVDELTADWSANDKAKLWRENAKRFYRID